MGSNVKSNSFLSLVSAFLLLLSVAANAQLVVSQQNASTLVQNVLIGSGVTVSNITFQGSASMIGRFDGTNSNIGLASGIIMSTGRIQDAVGPNTSTGAGENMNQPGYGPLDALLGGSAETQDAAVLRFNFFCEGNKVQFKYVFASEEYPEYVGSQYNDAFAFFIQGPGIAGMQNIALIPGTSQPVTINNVNAGSFSSFFINNGNGSGGQTVQLDGFTRPFVAEATVVPCQTYTITIAITDVSDGIYDSAVFLESSSFSSPEVSIEQKPSYINGSDVIYENCGSNKITLRRTGETGSPLTVFLENGGTATFGTDYTAFPTIITFPAGQSEVSFNIQAFPDNITETGGESVSIIYRDTGCSSVEIKRVDFFIYDPPPVLNVNPGQGVNLICPLVPVLLNASIIGGVAPYTTTWIGQTVGNPITVYPDSSSWYVVTVRDQCGSVDTDSVFANIPNYQPLRIFTSNDTTICKGTPAQLTGSSTGGKLPLVYTWNDILPLNVLDRLVVPLESTSYEMSVTDSCGIRVSNVIDVSVYEVHAVYTIQYTDHSTIQFTDLSYNDVDHWYWDFGNNSGESTEQNPLYTFPDTGKFNVELIVTNIFGCIDTVSNPLQSYPPFSFFIPNAFTPDGDGLNDSFSGLGEGFVAFEMFIFNRWGEMIFHTEDYASKWGTGARGVLDRIQIDVYAYKIILTKPTLERQEYIGRISVVR